MPTINGQFVDASSSQSPAVQQQAGINAGTDDVTTKTEQLRKVFAGLMMQNPKQYSSLGAIYKMMEPAQPTEAEKAAKIKKNDAERIVSQLEDYYFTNNLYYGNTAKGIYANTMLPILDPNAPASKYKAFLESNRPYLAKAAGDVGNLAFQEQVQAGKPFPTARFNKKSAIESFSEIRKKLNLPEKDYNILIKSNDKFGDIGAKYGY